MARSNDLMCLREIPVGAAFTFPEGTEDAGSVFVVVSGVEDGKDRVTAGGQVSGWSVQPLFVYGGDEMVVTL